MANVEHDVAYESLTGDRLARPVDGPAAEALPTGAGTESACRSVNTREVVRKRARKRGRPALRSGAPRMFGRHDGGTGRWYDEQYRALDARYGPFDALLRSYAAGVAVLWVEFQKATRGLKLAEETRAHGKGRRPSTRAIERLKRRQGLQWQSYDQAVRRLDELAARQTKRVDPLVALNRAVAEANRR